MGSLFGPALPAGDSYPDGRGSLTFTTIAVPGASFTVAEGINPAGEIVGLYFDSNDVGHGYLLSRSK